MTPQIELPKPTIGRIVLYRTDGRNGLSYDLPAMVTCTVDTHPGDYPDGKHNPMPVPSSDTHVHLTVFTPGGFGTQINDRDPEDDREFVGAERIQPGSGSYVEWDVPMLDVADSGQPTARSWRWPMMRNPETPAKGEAQRATPKIPTVPSKKR